jgi:hypothetical protein
MDVWLMDLLLARTARGYPPSASRVPEDVVELDHPR